MVKTETLKNGDNNKVKISATNLKNPDKTIVVYSDPATGQYEFNLPQGDYQVSYEGEGGEKATKMVSLLLLNPSDSISSWFNHLSIFQIGS